jgi:hypothetical protein
VLSRLCEPDPNNKEYVDGIMFRMNAELAPAAAGLSALTAAIALFALIALLA